MALARSETAETRPSFTVGDFHLLLFAGFDRRTRIQEFCTKIRALNLQDFSGAKVWCEILAIRRCHPQTSRGSRVRSVGYSANQTSATSGGSTGIRSDRTNP